MIEQYGTGIPRVKRYCDVEGAKFSYRQTANTTVIQFDRPGAQVTSEFLPDAESPEKPQMPERPFDPTEAAAMEIDHKNGRVTKRELMAEAGIGKTKATETLKTLTSKGILEWVGASTNDPRQYYRPIGIN